MLLSRGTPVINVCLSLGHRCGSLGVLIIMLAGVMVRDTTLDFHMFLGKGSLGISVQLFMGHGFGSLGVLNIMPASYVV